MPILSESELKQSINLIVDRLRAALKPAEIYVFGSYIDGTPSRHSDIDMLVVVERSDLDAYARDAVAYRALRGIRVPIDVQVYTRAEFDSRAALPVSFERTVKTKGKLLYAA